jgi:predicted NAD-dependent protein-ADP-ribosyltransferase YbiA (DUF1768 family)
MSKTGVVTFFDKKKEYRSLSNFWEQPTHIKSEEGTREEGNTLVYSCGEAAFHGEKYRRLSLVLNPGIEESRRLELLEYSKKFTQEGEFGLLKGNELKSRGGKGKKGLNLSPLELQLWHPMSVEVQLEISKYKLDTYVEVQDDLRKSGTKVLVHPAARVSDEKVKERFWEGRAFVSDEGTREEGTVTIIGQNMLGKIWMDLRTSLY